MATLSCPLRDARRITCARPATGSKAVAECRRPESRVLLHYRRYAHTTRDPEQAAASPESESHLQAGQTSRPPHGMVAGLRHLPRPSARDLHRAHRGERRSTATRIWGISPGARDVAEIQRCLTTVPQIQNVSPTAPSGFDYDLFPPLETIAARRPEVMDQVEVVATDLDPHAALADALGFERFAPPHTRRTSCGYFV